MVYARQPTKNAIIRVDVARLEQLIRLTPRRMNEGGVADLVAADGGDVQLHPDLSHEWRSRRRTRPAAGTTLSQMATNNDTNKRPAIADTWSAIH